jgi:hypothetical protein
MEETTDKLIGTNDLLEADNYLCAVKEGRVLAIQVNHKTIPESAKWVSMRMAI